MAKLPRLAYFCPNLQSPIYEMHALILEILSTFKMLAIKGHYIYFHQLFSQAAWLFIIPTAWIHNSIIKNNKKIKTTTRKT